MLILNSGGTFNKRYNPLNGELEVPFDNTAIESILKSVDSTYDLAGVMYKDSLDMTMDDRKILANIIIQSDDDSFIIVHGTDTIDLSAEFLSEIFKDKKIVLVGSMKPFEIDKVTFVIPTFPLFISRGSVSIWVGEVPLEPHYTLLMNFL